MGKLRALSGKKVCAILAKHGFKQVRQRGSHIVMQRRSKYAELDTGTAFFFKQWGGWGADGVKRAKKQNGRQFAGKTWDQMPASTFASVPN